MNVFDLVAKISLDTSEYDTGLDGASEKTSSFGSKLSSGLGTAAKIGAGAVGVVTAATTAAGAIFTKTTGDVGAYGDNIDKMSQKMGISAQAYQEWDAIMQHSGTSIEALKPSMKTLANAAQNNSEAFQRLGISQEEVANLSQEDLFARTIEGLQNMEESTERTALTSELLGRGSVELGALLNASAEETQAMRDRVHELGGVMSDEAVKSAAAYQDSLQDMKTAMSGVKRNLVSEFLPSVTTVMNGLQEVFSGNGDKGVDIISQGIDDLLGNLTEAVPKFLEIGGKIVGAIFNAIIDNLPKIIESGVQILLKLIQGIIEKLPDIIKAGLEIIVTLIDGITQALPDLIDTIVEVIIEIAEALTNPSTITSIIQAGIQLILALVNGLVKAIPQLVRAIPTIIKNLIQAIIQALPLLIQGAIQLVIGIVEALPEIITALVEAIPMIIEAIVEGLIVGLPMLIQGAIQLVIALVEHMPEIIKALIEAIPMIIEGIITAFAPIVEMLAGVFSQAWEAIKGVFSSVGEWFAGRFQESYNNVIAIWNAVTEFFTGIWEGIKGVFTGIGDWFKERFETAKNLASSAFSGIKSKMSTHWSNVKSVFSSIGSWFYDRFSNAKNQATSAWGDIKSKFTSVVNNIKSAFNIDWSATGRAIINGIKNGIINAASQIYETMKNIAQGALNIVKSFLGIKSPSRVFRDQVGKMISEGWAIGIEEGQFSIENAIKKLNDISLVDIPFAPTNIPFDTDEANAYNRGFTQNINVYSPVALNPSEVARQTRNATRNMVLTMRT